MNENVYSKCDFCHSLSSQFQTSHAYVSILFLLKELKISMIFSRGYAWFLKCTEELWKICSNA